MVNSLQKLLCILLCLIIQTEGPQTMKLWQQIISCLLTTVFILGWGCFYILCGAEIINVIIPGNLYHGGKPTDTNFYLFSIGLLVILVFYSLFFYKSSKQILINKVGIKFQIMIVLKSLALGILLFAFYPTARDFSSYFNIAHIETGFWYDGQ